MMLARTLHSMEVRLSVQDKYNVEIQKQPGKMVWASGCNSWYFNSEGRILRYGQDLRLLFVDKLRIFGLRII